MKKLLCVLAFVTAASVLWGHTGEDVPVPDPDVHPEWAYFPMQRSPRSILNEAGFLVNTAIDDFVDVIDWQNLTFDNSFLFAGGSGGSLSASFRGGGAGRIGGSYIGLYFSGDVLSGRGSAANENNDAFAEAANRSYGELVVNDNLIVLYGSELLGGLRFDLRFDQAKFTSLTDKSSNTETSASPFVMTLQWGRKFGNLSPKASVGVSWGGQGTEYEYDFPRLALKLEAAWGSLRADYQLSAAFDKTMEISGEELTRNGGIDNLVNLYWTARTHLTETLLLQARPQLQFDIYGCENKAAGSGGTVNNGELFYFAFAPILEAALHWRITPAIAAVTGLRFTLLRLESRTRRKGDAWTDDTGENWSVTGATAAGGGLAFELSPSEHFTLEAGIDSIFDFNESEYRVNITKLSGGFACIFRL
jgi:hypothetical protein